MNTQYTPGPWKAIENLIGTEDRPNCVGLAYRTNATLTSSGTLVQDHMMEANAVLMASAPDLLESLSVMTALCRLKYGNLDKEVYAEIVKAEERIRKAIP